MQIQTLVALTSWISALSNTVTTIATAPTRPSLYFIGDSITEFGSDPTTKGFITLLQHEYVRSVDVVNRGLAGYNTRWMVEQALPTLEYELATRFTPSLVVIWLGANDAALPTGPDAAQHVPLDEYRRHLTTLVRTLTPRLAPAAKLLLITPPTVIDMARPGDDRTNDAADMYAHACVEVARVEHVDVLDVFAVFNQTHPTEAERARFFRDGLHLSWAGNRVVAKLLDAKMREILDVQTLDRFAHKQFPDYGSLMK